MLVIVVVFALVIVMFVGGIGTTVCVSDGSSLCVSDSSRDVHRGG